MIDSWRHGVERRVQAAGDSRSGDTFTATAVLPQRALCLIAGALCLLVLMIAPAPAWADSGPPSVSIVKPADQSSYPEGLVPASDFKCKEGSGGTLFDGTAGCGATVDGQTQMSPSASGMPLPSSVGSHTITVTATDTDGLTTAQTNTYTVSGPSASITSPVNGSSYPVGSALPAAAFSCSAGSCSAAVDGTALSNGDPLPDSVGSHSIVVTATDGNGLMGTAMVTYSVSGPPSLSIVTPADGAVYPQVSVPHAAFSCTAGTNGSLVPSSGCTASVDGGTSFASGAALPGSVGSHTITVTATDSDGLSATKTYSYAVTASPLASVATPINGAEYPQGSVPDAVFSCTAGTNGTLDRGLAGCGASVDGGPRFATGAPLPGSIGNHRFVVTATDVDGESVFELISYTVVSKLTPSPTPAPPPVFRFVPPPFVSITSPVQGASYRYGEVLRAHYSCLVGGGAPGLKSCAGSAVNGHPVNTERVGRNTFNVAAISLNAESTIETITYTVTPASNRFAANHLRASAAGVATFALKLPGPGVVSVLATAWSGNVAHAARAVGQRRRRFVYARVRLHAGASGTLHLRIKPDARVRALIRAGGASPVIELLVTYAPAGGLKRTLSLGRLRINTGRH